MPGALFSAAGPSVAGLSAAGVSAGGSGVVAVGAGSASRPDSVGRSPGAAGAAPARLSACPGVGGPVVRGGGVGGPGVGPSLRGPSLGGPSLGRSRLGGPSLGRPSLGRARIGPGLGLPLRRRGAGALLGTGAHRRLAVPPGVHPHPGPAAHGVVRGGGAQLLGRPRRRRLLRPSDVDHRADGAQRSRGQTLDQVAGVLVERGDGAAVRPRVERPVRAVVRAAGPPGQRDDPLAVLALPRVPLGVGVLLAAQPEGVRDDVAEHPGVRAVGAHRVRPLGDLGGAGPLQQHRVGEPLDLLRRHPGRRSHLLHGRSGADAGLDLSWTQLALQLDCDLSEPGQVSPGGSAQLLVGRDRETLATSGILEDDRAVLVDPDDPQRSHRRPPRSCAPRPSDGSCRIDTNGGGAPGLHHPSDVGIFAIRGAERPAFHAVSREVKLRWVLPVW